MWQAYADVRQRVRWSVPEGEEIVYDEAEFATGGEDEYRCGPPGELQNIGHHTYHLVEPVSGFVFTDTIRRDGTLLAVGLLTWQLHDLGTAGTRVTVVDQVTSLAGAGMIDGHRNGHAKTLEQLARQLH